MWLLYSFLTAFFVSITDILSKKIVKDFDVYLLAWAWPVFTLPFLLVLLLFFGLPSFGPDFWKAALVSTIILFISLICYYKAIKIDDLSITIPMIAFTPALLLITSPLLLGEFPNFPALIGILLIVIGSYALNLKDTALGIFAPFKSLMKKGSRYMLIVAVLYSIGANVDKIGVKNSSPLAWILILNLLLSMAFTVLILFKSRNIISQIKKGYKIFFAIGFFTTLAIMFQLNAIKIAIVPHVIAIKRTSVVMTSIFGLVILKEKDFRNRLIGVILMMLGVLFISFLGES